MTPQKFARNLAADALINHGHRLAQIEPLRRWVVNRYEKQILSGVERARTDPQAIPGIAEDQAAMELALLSTIEQALVDNRLSKATLRAGIKVLVQAQMFGQGDQSAAERFKQQYGWRAPTVLLISPYKGCNLRCSGCYADSGKASEKLDWETVDRVITQAKTLWNTRLFAISGGEPFAYRSEGRGILDLVEKHNDRFFMVYTNGTLIHDKVAQRIAQAGNLFAAISVEGWRERTDERRGQGVFDRVLAAMESLRTYGAPFGISLTATRHNAEEIVSDEFIEFFQDQGALFGWIFQYMPIGRSFTLDLMPTPQQRVWMWRRSWEIVRSHRFFLADFWNSGTACDGCLSAGGHGKGGYFYIDWNGAVSPCVFMPFSPVNVKEVFAHDGTLNDVWNAPFFHAVRRWQLDYRENHGNGLMPCPIRDHHAELHRILIEHEPDPIDAHAAAALLDPDYAQGLVEYGETLQQLTQPIWNNHYLRHNGNGQEQRDQEASGETVDSPGQPGGKTAGKPGVDGS